ncbi:hypothetical protein PsorP6_017800 [Peronosclerospora sorghi]|uniref:Uncharacterized protein n=1 Tax=Peronosclerospora sorghi TaxID=230839 RepID=A0ACC0WMB0_9STRA|nr:hypothetical protein PsorP6_017800 [Peronosclerospora sorghi]
MVTLSGKIKAKKVAIHKLSLWEFDPEFVKIQNNFFEEIKFQYLKKNTAMALKLRSGEAFEPTVDALPTFLDEHITAFFRKKVTLSGKIIAKKATIQKLSEHDANGNCPASFQISHTMRFSEGLRKFDPEFVKNSKRSF